MAERDTGAEGFKEIAFGAFIYEYQKSRYAGSLRVGPGEPELRLDDERRGSDFSH